MNDKVFTFLAWLVLITLTLAIARQLSEQKDIFGFPGSWGRQFLREGFTDASPAPENAAYVLLADLPPAKKGDNTLTAQTCYQTDFLAQTGKTGNYLQRTNNFRHGTPDNCSAPRTELVNAIYANYANYAN
jgi:hypothetical protein